MEKGSVTRRTSSSAEQSSCEERSNAETVWNFAHADVNYGSNILNGYTKRCGEGQARRGGGS